MSLWVFEYCFALAGICFWRCGEEQQIPLSAQQLIEILVRFAALRGMTMFLGVPIA